MHPSHSYVRTPTRSVTAADVTFHYRELGPTGGIPVVLMIHLAGNLDNWDPQVIDAMAQDRHIITFDNRGVGASTGTVPDTIEAMADDARSFIQALGYDQVDVLGLSLGGMIAQALVLRYPTLVRKLILAGTGPKGGKGIEHVTRVTYGDMFRAALTRSDPKEFLFFPRNPVGKTAARAFVDRLTTRSVGRDTPVSFKAFRAQLAAIRNWARCASEDLSVILQPTLIVNGDKDRMVPTELSHELARRINGSELFVYPGSGHGSIFQHPEEFASRATRFLAS